MKLADINKELLKALNGPAPQHKVSGEEAFEFSEGSDGALHAKIVDHLGNPISNTNKLQVADTDVKAELELIKQQQQQILHRLDEPIDTQLTGSIAGKIIIQHENVTDLMNAGSRYFGEVVGSRANAAIDFGNYSNRAVYIENNHDVVVRLDIFTVSKINDSAGVYALFDLKDESYIEIPSGGTLLVSEETYPKVKLPFRFCRIRIARVDTPESGDINFYVFGGN